MTDCFFEDVPDHISLWDLRLAICQTFQQYANVRPTKIFRGTESPLRKAEHGDLDWVIVRENTEGEYAGQGGRSHRGQPWETATEVAIFTRHCVERLIRFAFEVAQKRPRKFLTVVTKSNAQRNGMVLWDEIAAEVAKDFPDVKCDKMLVDAMTCRMVLEPKSLDTIVATNLVRLPRLVARERSVNSYSTPTYSLTLPLHWQAPSASRRPATLTQRARTRPCSSPSTALHSTSLAKVSQIQSPLSGPRRRC